MRSLVTDGTGGGRQGPSATNQSVKIGVAAQKWSGKPGAQRGNIRFQAFNFVASILQSGRMVNHFLHLPVPWLLHTITSSSASLQERRDERSQSFALGCVVLSIKARRSTRGLATSLPRICGCKSFPQLPHTTAGFCISAKSPIRGRFVECHGYLNLPYDSKMEGGGHSDWSARLFWFPVLVFPNYLLKAQVFTERYSGFTTSASEHCQLALYLTVLYHEGKLYQIPTGDSNAPVYSRLTSIQPSKISLGVPGTFRPHFNLIGQSARVHDAFRIGGGSGGCPDRIPPTTCPGSPDPG